MTENTRVCPFCGAKNQPEARFCGYCGGPMEGAGYKPPTAAMPDEAEPPSSPNFGSPNPPQPQSLFDQVPLPPVTPPPPASTGAPIPPPPYGAPSMPPPMPSRRNKFLIPGIVIVLLLCGMCACLVLTLVFGARAGNNFSSSLPGVPAAMEITVPAIAAPDRLTITPLGEGNGMIWP